ncbi:MAG: TRAP transporter fused permease subunit [Motiliproteus sp.]
MLAMAAFHIWVVLTGAPQVFVFRGTHLLFALVLVFILFPLVRPENRFYWPSRILDAGLVLLAISSIGYLFANEDYVLSRFALVSPLAPVDFILGGSFVLLVLEAARRTVGMMLPLVALAFLGYGVFGAGLTPEYLIDVNYLTTEGILGIPIGVSATYITLFVLFGAFVEKSGTGKLFMDFALSVAGSAPGGPAKVACLTSALFGSISGSSTANVMTTGSFTIPLMKRTGYRPEFAGAVEAVASTGGQIMPPIMGAAAFVMAEFMGISYLEVMKIALVPALLYFVAVFFAIHFEAKRANLAGLPKDTLPELGKVLRERGHQIIPLLVIIGVLIMGFSAPYAGLLGIVSVFPVAMLRKSTRSNVTFANFIDAVTSGIRNSLQVIMACASAGVVVGVIGFSGLGLDFTGLVASAAQGHLVLALLLTAGAGIVLGMGLPTTPAYIVQVALLVPGLVELGVQLEAAHLFVFYFAIISVITPPVAISLFAANSLSGGKLIPSSIAALKLGATGYLVPFMCVFGPALMLFGTVTEILVAIVTSIGGVITLSASLHGYFIGRCTWFDRALLLASALVLMVPGYASDLIGAAGLAIVLGLQWLRSEKSRSAQQAQGI